jgi:glycosyltransferase involved in cell wall biosynthesis
MRILLGTATFHPDANGVSTFLQHLAPTLRDRGHEVFVVAPSTHCQDERRKFKDIEVFGIRSLPFPLNSQFRFSISPAIQSLLTREIDAFKPDIIHVQDPFPICLALLWIAKKRGIPVVGTHHTDVAMYEQYIKLIPPFFKIHVRRFEWSLLCWYFSLADAITAPTASAAAPLYEHGLKEGVQVISNGIDLERFTHSHNADAIRTKYHLPRKPILLTLGRMDSEKHVHHILEALPLIVQSVDIQFVIAGRGTAEKKLKKQVKKLGLQDAVTFVGFIPNEDVPELYDIAECFVIASTTETQSIVTMEAMASGLPIVAANALALPELVKDGENGFLFSPGDTKSLAEKVIAIFSDADLRESMSKKSLAFIEKHEFHHTAEAFEALYQQVSRKDPTQPPA